jgi:isopentenyldiphosphate isomerase/intracellular septation protein A
MNRFEILKKLLPGLLPLLVFVLVDEWYGTNAGLIVAVAFGIVELGITYGRERVLDKFTLFDTLLIVVLGSVSYFLENDIFFKLKPAFIGVILCILLGVSTFSKLNIFGMMSQKYLGAMNLNDAQVRQLNRSIRVLFYMFLFHTILVVYAAYFMSKEAWVFISTVLVYILFGLYLLFEVVRGKMRQRRLLKEEWLPLVDQQGRITGKAPRSIVHQNKEMLHPVVHMHVVNERKQVYLQKRTVTKTVEPGKWDVAVGGHVSIDENIEQALAREAMEELGLHAFKADLICQIVMKMEHESELVFLFTTMVKGTPVPNAAELEDGRFWNVSELRKKLGTGMFTPAFEIEFNILEKNSLL